MSDQLKELAGRTIIAGFEGTTLSPYLAGEIEAGELGGIILFSRNVESVEQIHALCREIRDRAPEGRRPLVCIDQEGGRVVRIRQPLTVLPPAAELAVRLNARELMLAGKLVGRELRALGITLNFAPVFDVNTNPDSPIIGDRAFGTTPREVILNGLAFARGLREGGVFPCAKHFPGHGDATVDSHLDLPTVSHNDTRLWEIEIEPFAAWTRTRLGPMMTAHVRYPALDPEFPATMSHKILHTLLVEQLHFDGCVVSDDLEMGAITNGMGPTKAAIATIRAGASGVLVCHTESVQQQIKNAFVREATVNPDFETKLQRAVVRIAPLAYPTGPDIPFEWIDSAAHHQLRSLVPLTQ